MNATVELLNLIRNLSIETQISDPTITSFQIDHSITIRISISIVQIAIFTRISRHTDIRIRTSIRISIRTNIRISIKIRIRISIEIIAKINIKIVALMETIIMVIMQITAAKTTIHRRTIRVIMGIVNMLPIQIQTQIKRIIRQTEMQMCKL